jgi:hypothetical protein
MVCFNCLFTQRSCKHSSSRCSTRPNAVCNTILRFVISGDWYHFGHTYQATLNSTSSFSLVRANSYFATSGVGSSNLSYTFTNGLGGKPRCCNEFIATLHGSVGSQRSRKVRTTIISITIFFIVYQMAMTFSNQLKRLLNQTCDRLFLKP